MSERASRGTLLALWTALAGLVAAVDWATGPLLQFPILFVLPVALAAWFNGLAAGLFFAVALPFTRVWFVVAYWAEPWSTADTALNTVVRIAVLCVLGYFVAQTARRSRQLAARVRTIEGLLPICGLCKKIRDEKGVWHRLEDYIGSRSEATFSHGVCEECARVHYGDLLDDADDDREAR